ncbi:YktB family protein [Alkalihalobacterium sp. APHAB7]|uniref:YktB family protein n=1 Tax=Alkalihalobacterium sp. APHAB7 TaxID=3402081 RepID=UPI003AAB14F7
MSFNGFTEEDFNVFTVEGLEPRMDQLKGKIRPKLEELGHHFAPTLSSLVGDEMYYHVAKHARRKVNPPKDTWVAIANSNRGYKMLPHFQIGLFETHLFVWFAVIYECPIKQQFAEQLLSQMNTIKQQIPSHFVWSGDHTKPEATSHQEADLEALFERLRDVKKAEILCGIHIDRNDPIVSNGAELIKRIDETFTTLAPLYRLTSPIHN